MITPASRVVAIGSFDNLTVRDIRFLEEASKLGTLTVLLWSDALVAKITGHAPKFPLSERRYLLNSIRYVSEIRDVNAELGDGYDLRAKIWADHDAVNPAHQEFANKQGIDYRVIPDSAFATFPAPPPITTAGDRKKVIVTGCFDWLHSGHVRFFEEVSTYGDLYVVVGHDTNIELLKGKGHPLLRQDERRYAVGSIRYVKQALISTGSGWLDAEPEIRLLKPDIYAVNEDGDVPEKRQYCAALGLEYLVLRRAPAPGLPPRTSTALRGF